MSTFTSIPPRSPSYFSILFLSLSLCYDIFIIVICFFLLLYCVKDELMSQLILNECVRTRARLSVCLRVAFDGDFYHHLSYCVYYYSECGSVLWFSALSLSQTKWPAIVRKISHIKHLYSWRDISEFIISVMLPSETCIPTRNVLLRFSSRACITIRLENDFSVRNKKKWINQFT